MSIIRAVERVFVPLFFAGILLIAAESSGGEQSREISLSVKVETERARDKTQTVDEKANATVTTMLDTDTKTCTLTIELENPGKQSGSYQLEWYFIAKRTPLKGSDDLVISDGGKAPLTLAGGESTVKKAVSKPFVFTIKDVDSLSKTTGGNSPGQQSRSGDDYAGYIVLVKADGEILEKTSNTSRFLRDEWIEKCAAFTPKAAPKKKK